MVLAHTIRKSAKVPMSNALKAAWTLFKKGGVKAVEFFKKETGELRHAAISAITFVSIEKDLVRFIEIADGKEQFRSAKLSLICNIAI